MSSEPKFSAGAEVLFVDGVDWRAGVVVKVSIPVGRHKDKPPGYDVRDLDGTIHRRAGEKIFALNTTVAEGIRAQTKLWPRSGFEVGDEVRRRDFMPEKIWMVVGVKGDEVVVERSCRGSIVIRDTAPADLFEAIRRPRPDPYFLVHGRGPAQHRHPTLDAAEREANRLADRFPGERFAVLGAISSFVRPVGAAVKTTYAAADPADPDDEIPF